MNSTETSVLPGVNDNYNLPMEATSFYSPASHTPSPVPQSVVLPDQFARGPVIVPSATAPEPKPRRKGGRKPKNDPVSI